jgi:hypothetical protein
MLGSLAMAGSLSRFWRGEDTYVTFSFCPLLPGVALWNSSVRRNDLCPEYSCIFSVSYIIYMRYKLRGE